ncbi:MAG: ribosome assembly RNA-binding protein YhbY [Deltaproteobacteria bacterium]|nr:ribosome assembly RNA-binding protein YhbY [Deltaproteobacteria bacterium]
MALLIQQKKFLKACAHSLKPVALIGKAGVSSELIKEIDCLLKTHELIKVKFNAFKDSKKDLAKVISTESGAEQVALLGNILILYRQQKDSKKRKIKLP